MTALIDAPRVKPVEGDDGDTREGLEIRQRREALGMSLRQLSEHSGINRATLANVEAGGARGTSVGAVRAALARLEREMGMDMPAVEEAPEVPDLLELEIEGGGFRVVVRGPVKDEDALKRTVRSLLEGLKAGPDAPPPDA